MPTGGDVTTMEDRVKDGSQKGTAAPGMKKADGSYIPAIIPPEWESYLPPFFKLRLMLK
jgi:hypothetical protein